MPSTSMFARPRALIAAATLLFASSAALSHDFWIRPVSFSSMSGQPVRASLMVGEHMKGESRPLRTDRVSEFVILGPESAAKPRPNQASEGDDPAGHFTATAPGLHVISYEGKEATITLGPAEFEAYLREEGLEHIVQDRAARGESVQPGRESYSRCAKSLISVDGKLDGPWATPRSSRLDLIPATNPLALKPGESPTISLVRAGKPLGNAKIVARREQDPTRTTTARTDSAGRASLPLEGAGVWLITSVHMERAEGRTDVDWLSLWASLTFEIAAPEPAPPAIPSPTSSPTAPVQPKPAVEPKN